MPKRVLVVEDHAPTRTVLRTILESEKADPLEVLQAGNGEEALKIAEAGGVDLVLLDINLPDMDGFTVCRTLRSRGLQMPIIFVTGERELKDYKAGREAGGDSYVTKPVSRAALKSLVALFLAVERKGPQKSDAAAE